MITAMVLAFVAAVSLAYVAFSNRDENPALLRREIELSRVRSAYREGRTLSEEDAQLLLEQELVDHRDNRYRHW